ncbi:zf-HC2 domain-containing protein [Paractinoplanes rishiriensis]|uniref:Putative zinc-finger domain-containing protein n=1 Tax=Paractinoplanes rishiriensis TaxID=1050105 RepID=A0A919K6K6_9ACTN|nr:zf-HC2 domain-containing protein [Actinoplanes rishiriensis]GIE99634.1 hypothetical protein Ari01nite_70990 [Actinoplanes rishiriensis]
MKDLLPSYAAGVLHGAEHERVRAHVADCSSCRADLAAWQSIAAAALPETAAPDPARLVRAVLTRSAMDGPTGHRPGRARPLAALVVAEARLIRPAVPIASALVMALGVAIVLIQGAPGIAGLVLSLVAPIVAAAGVAGTYRARRDPAAELVAAAPTSGRLLLLIRLALVFGYDVVLALAASAVLTVSSAAGTASLNTLVGAWLGPMALLSSLSLLVAVRFGPDVALGAAVGVWAVRVLAGGILARDDWPARFVLAAWSTNALVLAISAAVAVAAVAVAGRGEPLHGWRATHPM